MNTPTEALARVESAALSLLLLRHALAGDQHPALVYLARLRPGSRRTIAQALFVVAGFLGQTVATLDWSAFRLPAHAGGARPPVGDAFARRDQLDLGGAARRAYNYLRDVNRSNPHIASLTCTRT